MGQQAGLFFSDLERNEITLKICQNYSDFENFKFIWLILAVQLLEMFAS